jgi:hypothetical protein
MVIHHQEKNFVQRFGVGNLRPYQTCELVVIEIVLGPGVGNGIG